MLERANYEKEELKIKSIMKEYAVDAGAWKILCPKCGAQFSSLIKRQQGRLFCPNCGFDNLTQKDYVGKYERR